MIDGKLWSVRVYWGATRLLCWSLDSNKVCLQGLLDIPSAGAWKNCGLCGWGFETNPGLRSCFLLPGGDKGASPKVLFCSYFGCPVQEHLCISQGSFDILRSDSGKIVVCAGVLGSYKAFVLEPGQQ